MDNHENNLNDIKTRSFPSQNIVIKLISREIYGTKKPGTHFHVARSFYQNVFPNFTVINVETPNCFLRKFCPRGKYFIAFSSDQKCLEIYLYQGPSAAADLIQLFNSEFVGQHNDDLSDGLRTQIFGRFFKLKHYVLVVKGAGQLNRECSLFTGDGKYVIIGSAHLISNETQYHFFDIYTNNEAVTPNPRSPLEDYAIHIVDLGKGQLMDSIEFKADKIFLSHNQGIYLYKDMLAIMSVQHQTIHTYQIIDGKFVQVRQIGRFLFDDDEFIVSRSYNHFNAPNFHAIRDSCLSLLKQRVLSFMFRRALKKSEQESNPAILRKFFYFYGEVLKLRLWKMQLVDEEHLLIKFASEEVVTLLAAEPNAMPAFFVLYNLKSTEIIEIFDNTSDELVYILETFPDFFRNAKLREEAQFTCSAANNLHARLQQERFKETIENARYGGKIEAVRRILAQLPISAQSFSSSPYLDLSLFSHDDKWISVMERPKICGEYPLRFYSRDSGLLKFKIYAGFPETRPPPSARRLVAFTFHPTDPFAISVQRTNSDYIINFHVRINNASHYL